MFTLKKVKHIAEMSFETHCYSADLYLNGCKVAEVGNAGHGGCDDQHYLNAGAAACVDEALAKMDKADLDHICCNLVTDWLAAKELKRLMAKRVVYTKTGINDLYQTNCARNAAQRDKWAEQVQGWEGTEIVLNRETFELALSIFKERT